MKWVAFTLKNKDRNPIFIDVNLLVKKITYLTDTYTERIGKESEMVKSDG